MKIVALMCYEEFSEEARDLLKRQNLMAFSEIPIKGYKNEQIDESENWFGYKHRLTNSHLFYTMCNDVEAEQLMNEIENCRVTKEYLGVQAFQLNIEKFIN